VSERLGNGDSGQSSFNGFLFFDTQGNRVAPLEYTLIATTPDVLIVNGTVAPEPSALWLFLAGLIAVLPARMRLIRVSRPVCSGSSLAPD
jgi:hypothetical protein